MNKETILKVLNEFSQNISFSESNPQRVIDESDFPAIADRLGQDWVKVEERLPEILEEVIIAIKYQQTPIQAYWSGSVWRGSGEVRDCMKEGFVEDAELTCQQDITHWMPLPELPQNPEL